ncbi:hypothetical protein B7P43_G12834 [Cryptotermes secundus]|uniref:Endonuclease/exonuclease/phosphatase domain-containing protein n=1 Tax=Cryptotermes secundus TaxID=105785 RepID=A0A2J7PBR6_9NEOP|nr:hypothetical protein B7P43_G12834 [Cryptotermes secundus]
MVERYAKTIDEHFWKVVASHQRDWDERLPRRHLKPASDRMKTRYDKLATFIQNFDLDILLISETHFTDRSYIKIPKYNVYSTNHPDNTAHGGTAIIINQSNITMPP